VRSEQLVAGFFGGSREVSGLAKVDTVFGCLPPVE